MKTERQPQVINGKKLLQRHIAITEKIDKLFEKLAKENVFPLSVDGGGGGTLCYFRDADLFEEIICNFHKFKHVMYVSKTKLDQWVP